MVLLILSMHHFMTYRLPLYNPTGTELPLNKTKETELRQYFFVDNPSKKMVSLLLVSKPFRLIDPRRKPKCL